MTTLRPAVRCPDCAYRVKLRITDGRIGKHRIWRGGSFFTYCPGTGKLPEEAV